MPAKLIPFLALLLLISFSQRLSAEDGRFALLVGVSDYKVKPLKGPPNDVASMWRTLGQFGFDKGNITVLADRDKLPDSFSKTAALPTKAAIAAAFVNIAERVKKFKQAHKSEPSRNDAFVYIHLSGHGITIPVQPDDTSGDPDGTDEAFVPAGIEASTNKYAALLTDNEIHELLKPIRSTGAFVWVVFDACHSGGITRGVTDYFVSRRLTADDLGMPTPENLNAQGQSASNTSDLGLNTPFQLGELQDTSRFVVFYAAQSRTLAIETRVPDDLSIETGDQNAEGQVMGVFTYALNKALSSSPRATYRQIARAIQETYVSFGANMPPPLFEGDLDETVFFGKGRNRKFWDANLPENREYDPDFVVVSAGALNSLTVGSIVALYRTTPPDAPISDIGGKPDQENRLLGYVEIVETGLTKSSARPIEFGGAKALTAPLLKAAGKLEARLVDRQINVPLLVALPPKKDYGHVNWPRARNALDELRKASTRPGAIDIVFVDAKAGSDGLESYRKKPDVYLRYLNDRIWLLVGSGRWETRGERQTPSLGLQSSAGVTAVQLGEQLWRVARMRNLLALAALAEKQAKEHAFDINKSIGKSLEIKVFLLQATATVHAAEKSCPRVPVKSLPRDRVIELQSVQNPSLGHCDVLYITLANRGDLPVDITLFYLDAEAGIQAFYPGGPVRLKPIGSAGEARARLVPIQILTRDPDSKRALTVGSERLMVIGVERKVNSAIPLSFSWIAQPSLTRTRGVSNHSSRGARARHEGFGKKLLNSVLAQRGLRAGVAEVGPELEAVDMRVFSWIVVSHSKQLTADNPQ